MSTSFIYRSPKVELLKLKEEVKRLREMEQRALTAEKTLAEMGRQTVAGDGRFELLEVE